MNIITLPLDRWAGHTPEYKYDTRKYAIKYIVIHSTGGTDSRNWLSKWNKNDPNSAQNNVSIQYLVQRDGAVYRIIPDEKRAWHAGTSKMPDGETDGNGTSIGIELEHLNEPDYTDAQLNSAAELTYNLIHQYHITGDHVVSHASVATPAGRKVDPVHFDWGDFWDRIYSFDKKQSTPQEPCAVPNSIMPYSAESLTLARPQIDSQKLIDYVATRQTSYGEYTEQDVRDILNLYVSYGKQIGVDYVFAIAQMIHETGWLKSWWAAPPRRNPAGIGVSGQSRVTDPKDNINWFYDAAKKVWRKGQHFESWEIAVQHHLARLLCYARKDEQMEPDQLTFSAIIPGRERLASIRGCAPTLIGFNGVWAVPGKTYAQTIANIMNSFTKVSPA